MGTEIGMDAGPLASQLRGHWSRTQSVWSRTEQVWRDPVSRWFESHYWRRLSDATEPVLNELGQLEEIIALARRNVH